ncbi:hypothetical protein D3C76_949380 [compost metagenome]
MPFTTSAAARAHEPAWALRARAPAPALMPPVRPLAATCRQEKLSTVPMAMPLNCAAALPAAAPTIAPPIMAPVLIPVIAPPVSAAVPTAA